ncbi:MAG: UDP-N-acetylmuramoyl-L-alanyl-D-glutamate--2,6-diaminopimelate ligase [Acholeplasmataceae bacterium]|nr:UDP-N-acetylmuramoyl-L-alanyl-D-glutamate--2,6-diaminopimelate ligase [Acholeplasmataceae bacterium]
MDNKERRIMKNKNKYLFKKLYVIGITGTNGKTTISTLVYKYLRYNQIGATLIGTNGIYINDAFIETINTTPSMNIIYNILKQSYEQGIKYIIMEVSSHAIVQKRIYGIRFNLKLLTNVTIDHLDYHKTFKDYRKTKLKFINSGLNKQKVIINNDMTEIDYFNKKIRKEKETYGFLNNSVYQGIAIKLYEDYSKFIFRFDDNDYLIKTNLLGDFNCSNILGFLSILININEFNYVNIQSFFKQTIEIDGRMKVLKSKNNKIYIDYAHTPDGMDKVLNYLNKIKKDKLYVLFGCGGNRDKSKRPLMMNTACKYADKVIVTSDNPRNENPSNIIEDITFNFKKEKYIKISDRKKAIKYAISMLKNNDLLAILGRGNDDYYYINDEKIYLNDYKWAKEVLNNE